MRIPGLGSPADPGPGKEPEIGPIDYTDVTDIHASLQGIMEAGAEIVQDFKDFGYNQVFAQIKDMDGNLVGLRQLNR